MAIYSSFNTKELKRAKLFATALFALNTVKALRDPECKGPVKTFIRQVSEGPNWHVSAHYRSRKAAEKLASVSIKSNAQYQNYCSKNLRHEHMVPGKVVYELITQCQNPSIEAFEKILLLTMCRATITGCEDKLLARDRVPDEFYNPNSPDYMNYMCRYIKVKIDTELVMRPSGGWFVST